MGGVDGVDGAWECVYAKPSIVCFRLFHLLVVSSSLFLFCAFFLERLWRWVWAGFSGVCWDVGFFLGFGLFLGFGFQLSFFISFLIWCFFRFQIFGFRFVLN